MPATQLIISLQDFPSEGKTFKGELDKTILDFSSKQGFPLTPINYSLNVQVLGPELLAQGDCSITFQWDCACCSNSFKQTLELPNVALSLALQNQPAEINLRELVREEILIHLPFKPSCEKADIPQTCQPNQALIDEDSVNATFNPLQSQLNMLDSLSNKP